MSISPCKYLSILNTKNLSQRFGVEKFSLYGKDIKYISLNLGLC